MVRGNNLEYETGGKEKEEKEEKEQEGEMWCKKRREKI